MLRKRNEMTRLTATKSFCCLLFLMVIFLTLLVACSDDANNTVVAPQPGAAQTLSGTASDAANQKIENLEHIVSDLMAEWQQIKTDLDQGIMPDINTLKTSVNDLLTDLDEISEQLEKLSVIINSVDRTTEGQTSNLGDIVPEPLPGAERIFYFSGMHILEQNMATGIVRPIRRLGHPDRQQMGIEITESHIYWSEHERHGNLKTYIYRMNRANGDTEEIVKGKPHSTLVAVDESNGKIYWTGALARTIQRANLDGTGIETIHHGGRSFNGLDIHGSYLYWTDIGKQKIQRSALGGAQVETLIEGTAAYAIEVYNGKIYYTQHGGPNLWRANLDGTRQEVVVSGIDGWGLAVGGNHVHWTDQPAGETNIMRATLNGDNVQIVKELEGSVYDLALE